MAYRYARTTSITNTHKQQQTEQAQTLIVHISPSDYASFANRVKLNRGWYFRHDRRLSVCRRRRLIIPLLSVGDDILFDEDQLFATAVAGGHAGDTFGSPGAGGGGGVQGPAATGGDHAGVAVVDPGTAEGAGAVQFPAAVAAGDHAGGDTGNDISDGTAVFSVAQKGPEVVVSL